MKETLVIETLVGYFNAEVFNKVERKKYQNNEIEFFDSEKCKFIIERM